MSITVVPHLNFRGEARQALEFYQAVFGGELTLVTYQDLHNVQQPAEANLIMWGQVVSSNGFKVMAFDATDRLPFDRGQNSFFVAARFESEQEARNCWAKLSSDASVRQELGPAAWAPLYGMLQDKFGIVWVVDLTPPADVTA